MTFLLIFASFCTSINATFNQVPSEDPIISLTKTPCFGQCPAYKFEVFKDGSATYTGEYFVDMIGKWTTKIDPQKLDSLLQAFETSNFFEFKERYYTEVTDLPTTYLFFNDGERSKKIMDYYGAPSALKALESKIEQFITELSWKKIED